MINKLTKSTKSPQFLCLLLQLLTTTTATTTTTAVGSPISYKTLKKTTKHIRKPPKNDYNLQQPTKNKVYYYHFYY